MKSTIQEQIGKHFVDHVVQLVKEGRSFLFVLENIGWDVKVHDMRSDKENRSVHAVATSLVFEHVSSIHLPDTGRKKKLANCNLKDTLSLTDEEKQCTREQYKMLI